MWSDGKVHDLGTLGGTFSNPTGLTDDGHVSGVATTRNDETLHAVLWRNREIKDLETVPGDSCSWAWGLNSKDHVVGISLPAPCDFSVAHDFLWQGASMVDLNKLIPSDSGLTLVYGEAINEKGEIGGIGVRPGISPGDVEVLGHAFVLIPQAERCECQSERNQSGTLRNAKTIASETTKAEISGLVRRFRDLQLRKYRTSTK